MNPLKNNFLSLFSSPSYKSMSTPTTSYKSLASNSPSKTTNVSNSPAAVATTPPPVVAPASNPPVSQAKSNYMATLAPDNSSQIAGIQSQLQGLQGTLSSAQNAGYGANDQIQMNSAGGVVPKQPQDAGNSNNANSTSYLDAYRNYLNQYAESLVPSDEINSATSKLSGLQQTIDERSLAGRREEEAKLNEAGMLRGGAQEATRNLQRRNASEMADLGIAESGAARSLSALTGTAQARSNALKTAAELSAPIQVGDSYIDPKTGQIVYQKPQTASEQYGTGSIGEYNFAKSQGYTGSFNDYQNEDANRKALAAGGGSNGLTPGQVNTTVNQIAGAFDSEPIVKAYNTVNEGYQTIKNIGVNTNSPADDIAFIYAFAKIMDPNSVVREGEYNTIQQYAQTWADNFGFKAKRVFSNTNFLTPDAKQKMLNALAPKIKTIENQYNNLYSEYQRQINDAYGGSPRQLTNYAGGNTGGNTQSQEGGKFDYLMPQIEIKGQNSYLPRATWASLSQADKDALLAEAKSDGYPLLIKD